MLLSSQKQQRVVISHGRPHSPDKSGGPHRYWIQAEKPANQMLSFYIVL